MDFEQESGLLVRLLREGSRATRGKNDLESDRSEAYRSGEHCGLVDESQ